ncbi:MAG: hypothetical protein HYY18_20940 [Planctomycetes bacterium]|nr:hypothetical protein [Planctomycetota bacterium]
MKGRKKKAVDSPDKAHEALVRKMFAAMDAVACRFSATDRLPRERLHERKTRRTP